jgi:CRP/FNR family transcriptional regulator
LSVCSALEPDELESLDKLARHVAFEKRQSLFAQGELSDAVYNITSGSVRVFKLLPDGRRQIIGFALPGDFLGLALSERNAFCADALTATAACQFSRAAFSGLLDAKPHLLRRLHDMASHELSLAQEQMVILGRRTAEEKVVAFLLGLRQRWSRIDGSTVHVPLPMGRQDIGDFLGLTVETICRILAQMKRDGTLAIHRTGIELRDRRTLIERAHEGTRCARGI